MLREMEVKAGSNRVSFINEKVAKNGSSNERTSTTFHAKVAEERAKKPVRNVNITCKYDRKQMRVRLEVEEWMYDQLQELYDCQDGEDAPLEIDIDDVLEKDDRDKRQMLQDTLKEATQPVDEFITELLKRIQALRRRPSAPTRVSMEMDL